jgi:hypothetical protein
MKRTLVMDLEVYGNYFLAMFKSIDTLKVQAFEMFDGQPLNTDTISNILASYRIVTFNGLRYDIPVLSLALRRKASCEQLKVLSDQIIQQNLNPWDIERDYGIQILEGIDHIDLKEPVPGVMVSLKLYGARLHSKRLQDLPIEHTALITPEQRPLLRSYCENDLDTTIDLWNMATNPKDNIIATRESLTKEFGVDMRSKSDAQCAESMIKITVEKQTGRLYKGDIPSDKPFHYIAPAFIQFKTPALANMLAEVLVSDFVVKVNGKVELPEALHRAISIGTSTYSMGLGGLHSTETKQGHVATEGTLLRDRDVVSYYPSLILACGLFPKNMGAHFQKVFQDFFDRRMEAKRTGNKSVAQTLKIVLNGSFGKLGSPYSVLYSPDLLIQVTVTGQLAMLMLIERMEAAGVPVVSANTDGIVMTCPVPLEGTMLAIVKQWEIDTGLETEETQYRALYSRDVNNYLALKIGGGFKTKGTVTPAGPQKNPDYDIVAIAVCKFLDMGIPIAETIMHCRDIRKFLRVRTANGGCTYNGEFLGRVARWYRSTLSNSHIETVKKGDKVAGSDCAMPVMTLPDTLPADIDYEFYLSEASDLLVELGAAPAVPKAPRAKRVAKPAYVGSPAMARASGPGTSADAADSFDTAALELAVLKVVSMFEDGCIADEIKSRLPGCSWQSVTPRFAPLLRKGFMVDTGRKKKAASGRQQRIVAITEMGLQYV